VQGADRERQGVRKFLHFASRIPARLMSEESYRSIVEVPRDRGNLGVSSDSFGLVVKKRILHLSRSCVAEH